MFDRDSNKMFAILFCSPASKFTDVLHQWYIIIIIIIINTKIMLRPWCDLFNEGILFFLFGTSEFDQQGQSEAVCRGLSVAVCQTERRERPGPE